MEEDEVGGDKMLVIAQAAGAVPCAVNQES
jgi:hypothetical protein